MIFFTGLYRKAYNSNNILTMVCIDHTHLNSMQIFVTSGQTSYKNHNVRGSAHAINLIILLVNSSYFV